MQTKAVQELDTWAVITAAQLHSPALTVFFLTVSFFGTKTFLVPACAVVTGFLFLSRNRHFLAFPLTMLLAWFTMEALKLFFARPRPDFCPLLAENGYSFPSGHAFMGTVFFGFLAGLLLSHAPRQRVKHFLLPATFLFVFLLGASRIYLGVHYPTDVLAGCAGGLFFLSLTRAKRN